MSFMESLKGSASSRRPGAWFPIGAVVAVAITMSAIAVALFPTSMSEEEMDSTLGEHYGITRAGRTSGRSADPNEDDRIDAAINAAVAKKNWESTRAFEERAYREGALMHRVIFVAIGTVVVSAAVAIWRARRRRASATNVSVNGTAPPLIDNRGVVVLIVAAGLLTIPSCGEAAGSAPAAPGAQSSMGSVGTEVDALIARIAKDELEFGVVSQRLRTIGKPAVEPLKRFLSNYTEKTRQYQARSFGGDARAPGIIFQRLKFADDVAELLAAIHGG